MRGTAAFANPLFRAPDPAAAAAAQAAAVQRAQALTAARIARGADALQKAKAAFAGGKLNDAYQAFTIAGENALNDPLKQGALAVMKDLNDAAQAMLLDADKLYKAGDYTGAMKIYRQLASWTRLPAGRDAAQKLADAETDPRLALALQESDAARLYEVVDAALADKRTGAASPATDTALIAQLEPATQAKVMERLETISRKYSHTPTGKKAVPLFQALQADAKVAAAVKSFAAQEGASNDYAMAKMYRDSGLTNKAIEAYQRIMKDAPGSPWAAKAAADLAAMPKVN